MDSRKSSESEAEKTPGEMEGEGEAGTPALKDLTPSQLLAVIMQYGSSVDPEKEEEEEEKKSDVIDDKMIEELIKSGRLFSTVDFQERRVAAILTDAAARQYAYPDGLGAVGDPGSAQASRGQSMRVGEDWEALAAAYPQLYDDRSGLSATSVGEGSGRRVSEKWPSGVGDGQKSKAHSQDEKLTSHSKMSRQGSFLGEKWHVHFQEPKKQKATEHEVEIRKSTYRSTDEEHKFSESKTVYASPLSKDLDDFCICNENTEEGRKNRENYKKTQDKMKAKLEKNLKDQKDSWCKCLPPKKLTPPTPSKEYDQAWVKFQLMFRHRNKNANSGGVSMDQFLEPCPLESAARNVTECRLVPQTVRGRIPTRKKERELIKSLKSHAPEGFVLDSSASHTHR